LFVLAGALVVVEALGVLGLQPTSAKQATSANNDSNFIVVCIFDFLLVLPFPAPQVGIAAGNY
jgi:hypothetical protein